MWKPTAAVAVALMLTGCKEPSPEEVAFHKRFDRDAVLVKTCGTDPGVAAGIPIKVFRFENELWFNERGMRWRRVDGKLENVCDLLDIDAAHRSRAELPALPGGAVSGLIGYLRRPDPAPSPTNVAPSGKPND